MLIEETKMSLLIAEVYNNIENVYKQSGIIVAPKYAISIFNVLRYIDKNKEIFEKLREYAITKCQFNELSNSLIDILNGEFCEGNPLDKQINEIEDFKALKDKDYKEVANFLKDGGYIDLKKYEDVTRYKNKYHIDIVECNDPVWVKNHREHPQDENNYYQFSQSIEDAINYVGYYTAQRNENYNILYYMSGDYDFYHEELCGVFAIPFSGPNTGRRYFWFLRYRD